MNDNQFGLLLMTIQGCFGSNTVQLAQATPQGENQRQEEPAHSRNECRSIHERVGDPARRTNLRELLNRRLCASPGDQERVMVQPRIDEVGPSQPRISNLVHRDHVAESAPIARLEVLPVDGAIDPRTGNRLTPEENYLQ